MIKIMIVDDMPIFLEYLRGCIDWEAYGFEICCEAKDGKEALELLARYEPDIVLTDITMPFMNGIELAERIIKDYKEASVVLITGNNEFEYARKAVKLGVCDYIVKPFEKEELIFSLLKLQDNINRVLESKIEKEEIDLQKKEATLRKLMYSKNEISESELKKDLSLAGIHFKSDFFLVYTIKLKAYENVSDFEHIHKWEKIILNMIRDMLEVEGSFESFIDFENSIVTIVNFQKEEEMKQYQEYEFLDLTTIIKDQLGFDIEIGISDYCYGIKNIRRAYYQTLQALSCVNRNSLSKVFDYKKRKVDGDYDFFSWEVIDEIHSNLGVLNYKNIEAVIRSEMIRVDAGKNEEFSLILSMSLLSFLISYLMKIGRNIKDVFEQNLSPYDSLRNSDKMEERLEVVLQCYQRAVDYELEHKDTKSYLVAEDAKQYIENNYMDTGLCITKISKELLVNQTYLRMMFKKEMKMTLSEYINKIRMENARRMILEWHKLSYVSEMVGYTDVSYFSKCFKKYFGISPKMMQSGSRHRLEEH